jgi:hypothetical protein
MAEQPAAQRARGLFLGEIRTSVTGRPWRGVAVHVGDEVRTRRQWDNQHDAPAIEVSTTNGETLGQLSRRVGAWLAPLLDREMLRVEAVASSPPGRDDQGRRQGPGLTLLVFLTARGRTILEDRTLDDERDIAHAMVLWAWRQAQGGLKPRVLDAVFTRVRLALPKHPHPETQLLLAMQPSLVEEAVRTEAFCACVDSCRPPDGAAVGRTPSGNGSGRPKPAAPARNHPAKGPRSCSR